MNLEYTDIIKPRIYDINYGGHLGHVELINLLHETRAKFLNQYSLNEIDIDGHALVMRNLNITYKNQAFWDNELEVKMKIEIIGAKIIFNYNIFNKKLGNETGLAEATMVLINKGKETITKPEFFIRMLKNDNNKGKNK